MDRFAHRLRKNASGELPSQYVFVDTETTAEVDADGAEHHTLEFGWACFTRVRSKNGKEWTHDDWFRFETIDEFWTWVEGLIRPKIRLYLVCHNFGFDGAILALDRELPARGWDIGLWITDTGPPTIIKARKNKSSIVAVDSLNWFRSSLAELGTSLGIEKLPMPDLSDREAADTYCRRDVEIVREAMLQLRAFVRSQDLGNFQLTAAGQAFTAWRHRHMQGDVFVHDRDRVLKAERLAYSGGRVSVFRLGRIPGDTYYLDVNSLFPSEMYLHDFPTAFESLTIDPTLSELASALETHCVMAEVKLTTDTDAYIYRTDDRILFPVGTFDANLTTPELLYALENGHLHSINAMYLYSRAPLFRSYVSELYSARLRFKREGNVSFAHLSKLLLNSLYGRFAMRNRHWRDLRAAFPNEPTEQLIQDVPGGPTRRLRIRAGVLQELDDGDEGKDSMPIVSAHVTAYARMRLLALINKAGRANVHYVDTDSLFVNTDGFDRLQDELHESRLGALKLEGTGALEIHGPKDYRFGDGAPTIKGIRKDAVPLGGGKYRQSQFRSWNQGMRLGITGEVLITPVTKTLHRAFKQGTVRPDGVVEPFVVG